MISIEILKIYKMTIQMWKYGYVIVVDNFQMENQNSITAAIMDQNDIKKALTFDDYDLLQVLFRISVAPIELGGFQMISISKMQQ